MASRDKWLTIKMKSRMLWQKWSVGPKFGAFGRNSFIYQPDRILGRNHIFLGGGGMYPASCPDGNDNRVSWAGI